MILFLILSIKWKRDINIARQQERNIELAPLKEEGHQTAEIEI